MLPRFTSTVVRRQATQQAHQPQTCADPNVEFLFDSFFAEEGSQSSDEISEDTHQISLGVAFRMRAMAALWVSHPRVSAFSLLRPSADKM
jgi:hypothetical protein